MWQALGKEVDLAGLIKIAEETLHCTLEGKLKRAADTMRDEIWRSDEYRALVELQKAVAVMIGRPFYYNNVTAAHLQEWLKAENRVPSLNVRRLQEAKHLLDRVVADVVAKQEPGDREEDEEVSQ